LAMPVAHGVPRNRMSRGGAFLRGVVAELRRPTGNGCHLRLSLFAGGQRAGVVRPAGCLVVVSSSRRLVVSSSRRLVVSSSRRLVVSSSRRLVASSPRRLVVSSSRCIRVGESLAPTSP
jgi:hypothetical protein